MSPPVAPGLRVRVVRQGDTAVVLLRGELDLATAGALRVRLHDLLEPGRDVPVRHLVLDLADLSFCDVTGLAVLLEARRRLVDRGGDAVLRRPAPLVRRVVDVLGLSAELPEEGRTEEAQTGET